MNDIQRMLALPARPIPKYVPDLTPVYATPNGTMQLFPTQSWALLEIEAAGGLLAPIGVGEGKTLIALLAPSAVARRIGRAPKTLILLPADLRDQYLHERVTYAQHFDLLPVDVLSYEMLSREDRAERLREDPPELIVADEAHYLALPKSGPPSARSKRVRTLFDEQPETMFAGLSGTLTSRSIKDFAHLAAYAFKEGSPLPLQWHWLDDLAQVVDVDGMPTGSNMTTARRLVRALAPEVEGSMRHKTREALSRRLSTTLGVITTPGNDVGCSLRITPREIEVPEVVQGDLERLEESWAMPDGELLTDALAISEKRLQLAQGFYLRFVWPDGEPDWQWLKARSAWGSLVYEIKNKRKAGLDSDAIIREACRAGQRSTDETEIWQAWEDVRGRPEPPSECIWRSTFLVDDAARWALEGGKRVVWYTHREVGAALERLGLRHYGPGTRPNEATVPEPSAMSIRAHGTGKNLQLWDQGLCVCPAMSGKRWEQLLGRPHRRGQKSDEVRWWWYNHGPFPKAMAKAKRDAEYIQTIQRQRQRLLYAGE